MYYNKTNNNIFSINLHSIGVTLINLFLYIYRGTYIT